MTHWLMAAPSVVYKGRLSSIPKYVVLTGGRGVPCQEQQDCKWQTKKMQGSQAGNFRTHLKTHTKTQNTKLLHFFVSRLFILRSCIEFVKIWWLSRQKCWQWLSTFRKFNSVVVSLLREAIAFQIRSFCWTLFKRGEFCIILRAFWQHKFDITFFCRNIIIFGLGY